MDAPDVKSKVYENHNPVTVNKDAVIPDINIILCSDDERF